MIKEMQLEIGGQSRPLKFGTMGFLKHVNEVTGTDPLQVIVNLKDQYKLILSYVYAGLRCAGEKAELNTIDEWVQDMSFDDGTLVIKTATEAMLGGNGKAGEQEAQALAETA